MHEDLAKLLGDQALYDVCERLGKKISSVDVIATERAFFTLYSSSISAKIACIVMAKLEAQHTPIECTLTYGLTSNRPNGSCFFQVEIKDGPFVNPLSHTLYAWYDMHKMNSRLGEFAFYLERFDELVALYGPGHK